MCNTITQIRFKLDVSIKKTFAHSAYFNCQQTFDIIVDIERPLPSTFNSGQKFYSRHS
jgi:hypothetical protein